MAFTPYLSERGRSPVSKKSQESHTHMAGNQRDSKFSYVKLETSGKFLKGSFTVMFIDIVRFTKMGDNEALKHAVRALHHAIVDVFQDLEWDVAGPVTQNDAVMMPTGDGYGIGFESFVSDEHILGNAVEISNRLRDEGVSVRIGINHGPCFVHKDVNNKPNLAGWGVVDAERAMSCGGKNHILCTSSFAHPYIDSKAEPNLKPIGKYTKKERELDLFNYHSNSFGNSETPTRPETTPVVNNNKAKEQS